MKITMEVEELPENFTGMVEYLNCIKIWYKNGLVHKEDGPAYECSDGSKVWYLNGKRHREDGPTVERSDGTKEWWLNGARYTEEEFNNLTNKSSCSGKVVEIDGKKYKLIAV